MAASLAGSLAVPYAAGVPVPASQQQLRARFVRSVTHRKTRIMAAKSNPALRYEAGALFSTPSHLLDRYGGSFKIDKIIVAAAAGDTTPGGESEKLTEAEDGAAPGDALIQTKLTVVNKNIESLFVPKLEPVNVWVGEKSLSIKEIGPNKKAFLSHTGTNEGSVAGISYKFANQYLLYLAWSNTKGEPVKVYVEFHESEQSGSTDWDAIKSELDSDGKTDVYDAVSSGFKCLLKVDPSTDKEPVKLTAIISKEA